MRRWLLITAKRATTVAVLGIALLSGCGSLDKDATAKWDADRLYREARTELSAGNYKAARELLEKLDARYPFTRYSQQAQVEIAYAYYKEGESAQAISAADRFLKVNPNHANADYAQYIKGLASFDDDLGMLGRAFKQDASTRDPKAMREAFDAFRELVQRYPASRYAADARARMNYLVNAMAQSEVNVAQFYFDRGAYVAAIQRAQGALRDYQAAPAAAQALKILVGSYDALNLPELRDDARRILDLNFPATAAAPKR
ncbi:MAG: outer membrane protein assembly factor BamD [Betaproteobacteria bacterium]|jgi:outer membrane protein assembly factor BamD